MVKLFLGEAGSGKTKYMISKANELVSNIKGELVYIELTNKHANQLHRNVRCVFTDEFSMDSFASVYGFLCGLTSANHDIEYIFIDGLDKILMGTIDDVAFEFMNLAEKFSNKNSIDLYISASIDSKDVVQGLEKYRAEF